MELNNKSEYFLGANSTAGFFSTYDDLTIPEKGDKLYIIKSGPGSGKSSFMRNIANKMEENGLFVEYIYCSGDPESLDAVYFPAVKTAIVDGTSPHVIEPRFPAVCDSYIHIGEFYDFDAVASKKEEVMALFKKYKSHYKVAYDYLSRYGSVYSAFSIPLDSYKHAVAKKVKSIMKKIGAASHAPSSAPYHKHRFAAAQTYKGRIEYYSDLKKYDNIVLVGSVSGLDWLLCDIIKDSAEEIGLSTVSYLNPLFTSKTDHIALPELSTVFVSKRAVKPGELDTERTLNIDSIMDSASRKQAKKFAKVRDKACGCFLSLAEAELSKAKAFHDELEALYNPYVDFKSVYELSDSYLKKIIADLH